VRTRLQPYLTGWSIRRALATAGLVVLFCTAVVAVDLLVRYLPAVQALQAGRDAATSAENSVRAALATGSPADFAAANAALVRSRDDFTSGSSVIDDGWLAGVASYLPWIGDEVQAVRAMRHAGAYGSQLGIDLLPVVQRVIPSPGSASTGTLARIWAAASSQAGQVADAQGDLGGLDTAINEMPAGTLVGPLDRLRTTLREKGTALSATAHLALNFLANAPAALGTTERRYLITVNNPAEERPGGGFIGAIGEVDIQDGQVLSEDFQDSYFANGHIPAEPAPRPLDTYLFHGAPWELADSNWFPDYPTSAASVSRLYTEASGHKVDGVISVDPVALSYVLKVIGPVQVPPYPQRVSADNTLLALNYITNKARPGDPGKAFLPPFAKLLFDRLLKPATGQLSALVAALGRGVAEKHIVLEFTDPALENVVTAVHAGGQQIEPSQDGLLVTDANLSGGKEDLFVARQFALTATVGADGTVNDKLVLTYHYPAPTTAADNNLIPNLRGDYNDYVQIFVPANAAFGDLKLTQGGTTTSVSTEDVVDGASSTDYAYFLLVPKGQTVSLELDYSGPFSASGNGYQLTWEKQLNALTWPITVDVHLPGQPVRQWSSDLDTDRVFSAP
jgi:hypothetical protein